MVVDLGMVVVVVVAVINVMLLVTVSSLSSFRLRIWSGIQSHHVHSFRHRLCCCLRIQNFRGLRPSVLPFGAYLGGYRMY